MLRILSLLLTVTLMELAVLILPLHALEKDTQPTGWQSGKHALTIDQRVRTFLLDLPAKVTSETPMIFVFHGTGGTAEQMQKDFGFRSLFNKHGFITVYPQATNETNPDKTNQFNVDYAFQKDTDVDDVGFVRQLFEGLSNDFNSNRQAVFATGFSNGADMCYYLASQEKPFVSAIAPVAGTVMVSWGRNLKPAGQTSILAINSRDDTITLWNGDLENKDGWGAYYGIVAVTQMWAKGLNLSMDKQVDPAGLPIRDGLILHRWQNQNKDVELLSYQFEKLGHAWPEYLGDRNVPMAEEIWRFFDRHRSNDK
jgi:polyhydroxybutyrate depolymerase